MSRLIIISNRLPFQLNTERSRLCITPSVGGLATGLKSVHKPGESLWIGWPGITEENITPEIRKEITAFIRDSAYECIPLSQQELDIYYHGFSNKTLWPLFHYFIEHVQIDDALWNGYKEVNRKFAEEAAKYIKAGDEIWVHDYHLLLLPKYLKEILPNNPVGLFLHIPFPSSEVFRILPWRREILEGMLSSDLVGFHTYDYVRHFISSVRNLLGHEISLNEVRVESHLSKADSFPMGIDYDRFHSEAVKQKSESIRSKSRIHKQISRYLSTNTSLKLILSIDRLDYTKGIADRLHAFDHFLETYPDYRGKATLIMLCVPSRANIDEYKSMKREVEELVGMINGKYGTITWNPVWYFYRSMPFKNLIALYTSCDVALLTPTRDGMNLVAKEYIASRTEGDGVLILSEMAGAANELGESLIINPIDYSEVASAIKTALSMDPSEQSERISIMQQRLKRYDVTKWATDFVKSLQNVEKLRDKYSAKALTTTVQREVLKKYSESSHRILFLDYDGTLVGFQSRPELAYPDEELKELLDALALNPKNRVVIISGRDKDTLGKWFKDKDFSIIAEHGAWLKLPYSDWQLLEIVNLDWKDTIRPVLEIFVDRTPGAFLEEKHFSLVWHFRKANKEQGFLRATELKAELANMVMNDQIEILEGNKVIEVKNVGINKGRAALTVMGMDKFDFILGAGDDYTDEYLFKELPESAVTIKVGTASSIARFNIGNAKRFRDLLRTFAESEVSVHASNFSKK